MAIDSTISGLPYEATNVGGSEYLVIDQSLLTKKITVRNLLKKRVVSQNDLPNFTIDADATDLAVLFTNQNFTIDAISGTFDDGQQITVYIINNTVSDYTIALDTSFELMQSAPATVHQSKLMIIDFRYSSTVGKWFLYNWKEQI